MTGTRIKCKVCNKKITGKGRNIFCSDNCYKYDNRKGKKRVAYFKAYEKTRKKRKKTKKHKIVSKKYTKSKCIKCQTKQNQKGLLNKIFGR